MLLLAPLATGFFWESSPKDFKVKAVKFIPPSFNLNKARHVISISNPTKYNETDLLYLADKGIDVHNWGTWFGGRYTPYRNTDGSYYFKVEQKELLKELYNRGQRVFWVGFSADHAEFIYGLPQGYDELAGMVKAYIKLFNQEKMWFAKAGVYTGGLALGQDEVITHLRPEYTWGQQYALSELHREEVKSRLGFNWLRVKWLVTGQDFMVHDNAVFQLTNDPVTSYWAHHTAVSEPFEVEDLVYHNVLTVMADPVWKAEWGKFLKLAWTDSTLVEGVKGSRVLTALGESVFE